MREFLLALCLALIFLPLQTKAQGESPLPPVPKRYFNDYAAVTTQKTLESLNETLSSFDAETTNQVVVAVFPEKTSTLPVIDFCARTFNEWKVGQKGKNNGVVLFVFIKEHLLRISTGLGMEAVLPDRECKRIIDDVIVPEFRKRNFDAGLTNGVSAILKSIRSNETPH